MKKLGQFLLCFAFSGAAMAADPVTQQAPAQAEKGVPGEAANEAANDAAKENAKEAVQGKVKVILLRSGYNARGPDGANVWLNEVPLGSVAAGEFINGEADAGKVVVRIKPAGNDMVKVSRQIDFNTIAGQTYYVYASQGVFAGYKLSLVSKEEALKIEAKYRDLIQWRKNTDDKLNSRR